MPHAKVMLGGIFVGGASRRMGQVKALLGVPSVDVGGSAGTTSLLERTVTVVRQAGLAAVIVGRRPELPKLEALIRQLGVPVLEDAAVDAGPLGGLVALLEEAQERARLAREDGDGRDGDAGGSDLVLALPCDLPELQPEHLVRLAAAPSASAVVAARREGRWEPLAARYASTRVLPIARRRLEARQLALQGLLDEVGAAELPRLDARVPDDLRWLDDWDTPQDVLRSRSRAGHAGHAVKVSP